jgi:hypothetical protein
MTPNCREGVAKRVAPLVLANDTNSLLIDRCGPLFICNDHGLQLGDWLGVIEQISSQLWVNLSGDTP